MGMSMLPPSSKYLQRSNEPVDETERDSLTKRLSDAFTDGRLGQDEYMAALDVVYSAGTLGDLVPVIEKLPAAAASVPAIVESGNVPAGELAPSKNLLVPAMAVVGGVLVTLVVIAVLLGLFIF